MLSIEEPQQLFTLHGEFGYFDLFGSKQLPFMIVAPRGFGKSELFLKLIERFSVGYVRFVPVCTDGIVICQDSRSNIYFSSSSDCISIRGRNGENWKKKSPIAVKSEKNYFTSLNQLQKGVLLVGALGVKYLSELESLIREKGHKIKISEQIELKSIIDTDRYLFKLLKDMYFNPSNWQQIIIAPEGILGRIEEEYRLICKIKSFLPHRILELTLPEEKDKWGQLNNVFSMLVEKIDELILNTVEEMLNSMLSTKIKYLYEKSHFESLFPENKQLANLTPLPTMYAMKAILEERVNHARRICLQCALPQTVTSTLEEGLSNIKTLFIDQFDNELKRNSLLNIDKLENILQIHGLAISELSESVRKELVFPETMQRINDTKEKFGSFRNRVDDLKWKENITQDDKDELLNSFKEFIDNLLK